MNLANKLKKQLPQNIYGMLAKIGYLANKNNYPIYVVGGFVRDLILGVRNLDIDLVAEKNGIEFAKILSRKLNTALVKYPKFGTATLVFPAKFKLDVATSRSEIYISPGALPEVKFGSIKDDLYRRDFSINAMAIALNKENFGELIDFFGGLEDLRAKQIKVLHNLSFVDDPTRIFRAVRFEGRYDFKIEAATERLIKEAITLKMFEKVSGERLRNEIVLLLSEKEPLKFILRMQQLDQLRFIHPRIKLDNKMKDMFKRIPKNYKLVKRFFPHQAIENWLLYFIILIKDLNINGIERLCKKFVLTRQQTQKILAYKRTINNALAALNKNKLTPSQIYEILNFLSPEAVILILSHSDNTKIKRKILLFFKKINKIRLRISGAELQKLNVIPGPLFKEILDRILFLKINGKIKNKHQELYWAKQFAQSLSK